MQTVVLMMKGAVFIISMAVLALAAVAAVTVISQQTDVPATFNITSLATNSGTYKSNERMDISVLIFASKAAEDCNISVEGIRDSRGRMRLSDERQVNLTGGENTFNFSYDLPVCSRCAGLGPGEYFVNASVIRNGTVLATASRPVQLV
jgi:hypothetical protein